MTRRKEVRMEKALIKCSIGSIVLSILGCVALHIHFGGGVLDYVIIFIGMAGFSFYSFMSSAVEDDSPSTLGEIIEVRAEKYLHGLTQSCTISVANTLSWLEEQHSDDEFLDDIVYLANIVYDNLDNFIVNEITEDEYRKELREVLPNIHLIRHGEHIEKRTA